MFDELTRTEQRVDNVTRKKHPKMYHVVMYNDDITPFEYVMMVLMEVFNYDPIRSIMKTDEIHRGISSIIGTYDRKSAEDYCDRVADLNAEYGFSLLVTAEEANNGGDDKN